MFSLPQKLTAPFGLLPDAEKLAFRSQPSGLIKLATVRNIPETDSYWNQYTVLFDSASEVYSLITPHDVRRALLDAPENIATLIRVITARLTNLISDHTFPTPTITAANAIAFMKAGNGDRNTTKEVLNCLRVLQRVLPVVFEVEGESSVFELQVLWRREEVYEPEDLDSRPPQFVIEDEDASDEESAPKPAPKPRPKSTKPALGEKLFGSIVDLLFCCGFTLPTKIQVDHHKINYIIWEKGVGSTSDPGPNAQYDNNKTEVLRLLLVLLSRQIYVPPSSLFSKPSLYSLHLVQKIPRRDVLTILCSLLNTVMNSHMQVNSSLGGMAGRLPYNHLVFKGEDTRSNLIGMSLQVLIAALDFQSGSAKDNGEQPTAKTNSFRYFLMKLHRTQDFAFIFDGIMGIYDKQLTTINNVLPGARKSLPYVVEATVLLWKILELNKKFRVFVIEHDKCMDLVGHLLCYNLEIKDKPQQHGICRTLSYIIQSLSAESGFGAKLSKPLTIQVPSKWAVPGNAADFMINAIYSIVATTSGSLNALYPALVISLSNFAPHFKNLSVTTSARLIQLFKSFSNPLFLLADEGHPRLLFFMLELFNGVIFYHLAENPNLIYGILSSHKLFEDLGTFTLSRAVREIKRVQSLKEQQGQGVMKSPRGSNENEVRESEKSRLLASESQEEMGSSGEAVDREPELSISAPPPMSPTTESVIPRESITETSEKARGKQKERRSSSTDVEVSLERVAALGIGRNGFVPSQEWVRSWQQGLPLDPVMLVISELLPKIQVYHASRHKTNATAAILDFLGSVTLKEVLPPVPPLNPRKFTWSDASMVWLTSLIWGEIYLRGMSPLGIWNSTNVRLFYVKHSQHQQQHQITEAVSNVVGGLLRRTNSEVSIVTTRPR
ncbi:high-temperature-induced dauer-formation protein-domain-containing protein [Mucidula mucida]|nr:high-temperature-induced dauer-formation protein-domain-containing protein [Mucidula mucida]